MTHGSERRDRKPFEPPPWEREAFEQLASRREPAPEAEPEEAQAPTPAVVREAEVPAVTREPEEAAALADGGVEGESEELPDGFHAMLEHLRGTEAQEDSASHAGAWVALVVAVFGVVMFVWGTIALFRGGGKLEAAAMAMALMSVGGLFAAAGAWSAMKNLKRQGVL